MKIDTLFHQARKSYEGDWKPEWSKDPTATNLANHFRAVLRSADQVLSHAQKLKASGNHTEKGLREAVHSFAMEHAIPAVRGATDAIKAATADLVAQRAKLSSPASDPHDMAAAMRRTEIRGWFLNMGPLKSMAFLTGENVDPIMAQAVLEMPPQLSGLDGNQQAMVSDNLLRVLHGKELAKLEEVEDALTLTRAALSTSLYHMRQEVQFGAKDLPTFDEGKEAA